MQTLKTQMKCSTMGHFIRIYTVCSGKKSTDKKNAIFLENYNMTPLDMYHGLSQVYFIKSAGRIHQYTMGKVALMTTHILQVKIHSYNMLSGVRSWICRYCKFGNFPENFTFANSVKRHICNFKNSRLGHDFPTSVNDRVISPFHKVLFSRNFAYGKFWENKTHENFRIYSISSYSFIEERDEDKTWEKTRPNFDDI